MPECQSCRNRETGSPVLNFRCAGCCAEQVRRCRPSRKLQEMMLQQLTALYGAPTREEILETMK